MALLKSLSRAYGLYGVNPFLPQKVRLLQEPLALLTDSLQRKLGGGGNLVDGG